MRNGEITLMSRDLELTERIQFHSIVELKDGLTHAATRLARRTRFRGRKLGYGPMANAIIAQFLRLPEDQQAALVESGVRLLETMLESDEPRDDLVAPGSSSHQWLMPGSEEDPAVESGVAPHARVSRRNPNAKRIGKSTEPA